MSDDHTAQPIAPQPQHLKPLMVLKGADADTPMGEAIGEGLILADATTVSTTAHPLDAIPLLYADTNDWITRVIRRKWLVNDIYQRLFAVPKGVNGQDGFIGAWEVDGQLLQIAVTRERVHLVTQLIDTDENKPVANQFEQVSGMALGMLHIDSGIDLSQWQFRQVGGLSLAYRDHVQKKGWQDSLIMLTDGSAVKFSITKQKDGQEPPGRESLFPAQSPWFP